MGYQSAIEWTDHTFNPWVGCSKVHAGCEHCYAETLMDKRLHRAEWGPQGTRVVTSDANWDKPHQWNAKCGRAGTRARVFCASLADVFEDRGELERPRRQLWSLIDYTPHLDWLLLTKRPQNILGMTPPYAPTLKMNQGRPRPNLWLGTSISDQSTADKMIPPLLECRELCAGLFVSAEPLLGPIDLRAIPRALRSTMVRWVIAGGESGPQARPMHPDWARSLRDQCIAAGVPFFLKQWGEWSPDSSLAKTSAWKGDGRRTAKLSGTRRHRFPRVMRNGGLADDGNGVMVYRVGKARAGATLDGREWRQTPFAE